MSTRPNRVLETMTRVEIDNFIVRVWRTSDRFNLGDSNIDIVDTINSFSAMPKTTENMYLLLSKIEELPNIAAAEILDKNGNGVLLYPDWN